MPGQKQGQDLVAHLLVGHTAAVVGVLGLQEDREEVAAVLGAAPPVGDHPVDELIEPANGPAGPHVVRDRKPQGHELEQAPHAASEELRGSLRGIADGPRLVRDVGVEEGLGDDGPGEGHHLVVDVENGAIPPARRLRWG